MKRGRNCGISHPENAQCGYKFESSCDERNEYRTLLSLLGRYLGTLSIPLGSCCYDHKDFKDATSKKAYNKKIPVQ